MDLEKKIRDLENQLQRIDSERVTVIRQINSLREEIKTNQEKHRPLLGRQILTAKPISNDDKVRLYLDLFRARRDIYPKLWENKKNGKKGYSPVCANEWNKPLCEKPKIKCANCKNQRFLPLDESAVESHLRGNATIGTYAIKEDDTCVFLSCDFDESSWQLDIGTYRDTARAIGIDVAVERSCSGNGGHAWIFFEQPISARLARSLGTLILAQCSERNLRLSLESYDRFFPSQDYLPKGGFGNLIALPLQKNPRDNGNSCFVDDSFEPWSDQWEYLSKIRRLSGSEVRQILSEYMPQTGFSKNDGFEDVAWLTDNKILEKTSGISEKNESLLGEAVECILGPMLTIPIEKLPGRVLAKLKKTASFANPEFYKLQRMRMQTYPHSRFIFSGQISPTEIALPRGVLDEVTKILVSAGAQVVIRDERIARKRIKAEFTGQLTEVQAKAVKVIKKHDVGILMAPPGSGKTVMGCALIAERKVSTLVLVHRQPLLEQWRERISTFLSIPPKEIGNLSGTKKKMTGKIDLAMLQSLSKIEDLSEIAQSYSQIIIDECHHIPATSFEAILKQLPARYVMGLTATPYRKDGLEKILFQQCGPIRHEIENADGGLLSKSVTIFETGFRLPEEVGDKPPYHVLVHYLTTSETRNRKIISHVVEALSKRRFPMLISDRKEHLETLSKIVVEAAQFEDLEIIRLDGDLSPKQRREAIERIHEMRAQSKRVLLMCSASLVGEGFDLPALDTLILSTPLSFEGRMVQYAGRLHRLVDGKTNVEIIDYVDSYSAMLIKMYRNRLKAYRRMGYVVNAPSQMMGAPGLFGSNAGGHMTSYLDLS